MHGWQGNGANNDWDKTCEYRIWNWDDVTLLPNEMVCMDKESSRTQPMTASPTSTAMDTQRAFWPSPFPSY